MPIADVAVIGGGIIGAAISWELKQQHPTLRVLLLETHRPVVGATAYSAGILRRHHTFLPDVELAARSLDTYRSFTSTIGGECGYNGRGFMLILPAGRRPKLEANLAASASLAETTRILEHDELAAKCPEMVLSEGEFAVIEESGGFGSPIKTAISYRRAFAHEGGGLIEGCRVDHLLPDSGAWLMRTNIGEIRAHRIVVAAGAASFKLAWDLDISLPLTPRRIGLARLVVPEVANTPVVIDDVTGTYFVPEGHGVVAVGARARAEDERLIPAEPLTESEVCEAISRGSQRVRGFRSSARIGSQAAVDGYSTDGRPLLGAVTGVDDVLFACGFSGGGYKIAPEVARIIAKQATEQDPGGEAHHYRISRFAEGQPCRGENGYAYI